jgi:acetyl-CoA C-acetyltransferase
MSMGETAENVADKYDVTREEMDQYALQSQMRAVRATKDGIFAREIIPVPLASGLLMTADDGPRADTSLERLATLKPVFREGGRVTAGNSCPLNDGAAAAVVMSAARAAELGITPIARVISTGVTALEPELMGLGPIEASRQALARAGMTIDDVDVVEINEAFAAQVIPSARGLGVDPFSDKLNPHGGAIALGHPFGMTGVRILATLLNDLRTRDQTIGLETMCVGGGQGMAMIIERLS